MATDPDDPVLDWGEQANTSIDAPRPPEVDTEKFRSLDYAMGRESGFTEGVDIAGAAIAAELLLAGFTPTETARWRNRITTAALAMG